MKLSDNKLEILTLGRFTISTAGKVIAPEWPDELVKVLFCSLLSPLDLSFSWDRICRSMWGIPATSSSRRQLEEALLRPLNTFLLKEFGFNPLLSGPEGLRIDQKRIHLDALDFHHAVVEGLTLLSIDNPVDHAAALKKLERANTLYAGIYLPGIPGKIIANTRNDLEALYQTSLINSAR